MLELVGVEMRSYLISCSLKIVRMVDCEFLPGYMA